MITMTLKIEIKRILAIILFITITDKCFANSLAAVTEKPSLYQRTIDKLYKIKQKVTTIDEQTKQALANIAFGTAQTLVNNYATSSEEQSADRPLYSDQEYTQPVYTESATAEDQSNYANEDAQQNYYQTLGLSTGASQSDIRKAYLHLARQYHPDKNQDPDAVEKFKEIAEAYDALSD